MDGSRFEAWTRTVTPTSGSRRRLVGGFLAAAIAGAMLGSDDALAKKKKKRKKNVTCPSGESRCPQGFPSPCCAAGTTCCDTSRLGCCQV